MHLVSVPSIPSETTSIVATAIQSITMPSSKSLRYGRLSSSEQIF